MSNRIPIRYCEPALTQGLVRNEEDGENYWVTVYNITCTTADGRRWLHEHIERTWQAADAFCDRIYKVGSINPDKWLDITRDPDELPDYVTDPHRAEFN